MSFNIYNWLILEIIAIKYTKSKIEMFYNIV